MFNLLVFGRQNLFGWTPLTPTPFELISAIFIFDVELIWLERT